MQSSSGSAPSGRELGPVGNGPCGFVYAIQSVFGTALPVPHENIWYSRLSTRLQLLFIAKEWHAGFASQSLATVAAHCASVVVFDLSHDPLTSSEPQLQCALVQPLPDMQDAGVNVYCAGAGGHIPATFIAVMARSIVRGADLPENS